MCHLLINHLFLLKKKKKENYELLNDKNMFQIGWSRKEVILKWMETWSQLCRPWSQNLGWNQNHFKIISDAYLNGNGHLRTHSFVMHSHSVVWLAFYVWEKKYICIFLEKFLESSLIFVLFLRRKNKIRLPKEKQVYENQV